MLVATRVKIQALLFQAISSVSPMGRRLPVNRGKGRSITSVWDPCRVLGVRFEV